MGEDSLREMDGQLHEQWTYGNDGAGGYWQQVRLFRWKYTVHVERRVRVTVRAHVLKDRCFAKAEIWTAAGWVQVWTLDCPALLEVAKNLDLREMVQSGPRCKLSAWLYAGMDDAQRNAFDADAEEVLGLSGLAQGY